MRDWWETVMMQEFASLFVSFACSPLNEVPVVPLWGLSRRLTRCREDTEAIAVLKPCLKGSSSERQGSFQESQARVDAAGSTCMCVRLRSPATTDDISQISSVTPNTIDKLASASWASSITCLLARTFVLFGLGTLTFYAMQKYPRRPASHLSLAA